MSLSCRRKQTLLISVDLTHPSLTPYASLALTLAPFFNVLDPPVSWSNHLAVEVEDVENELGAEE